MTAKPGPSSAVRCIGWRESEASRLQRGSWGSVRRFWRRSSRLGIQGLRRGFGEPVPRGGALLLALIRAVWLLPGGPAPHAAGRAPRRPDHIRDAPVRRAAPRHPSRVRLTQPGPEHVQGPRDSSLRLVRCHLPVPAFEVRRRRLRSPPSWAGSAWRMYTEVLDGAPAWEKSRSLATRTWVRTPSATPRRPPRRTSSPVAA